jgi:hypothetical protein
MPDLGISGSATSRLAFLRTFSKAPSGPPRAFEIAWRANMFRRVHAEQNANAETRRVQMFPDRPKPRRGFAKTRSSRRTGRSEERRPK